MAGCEGNNLERGGSNGRVHTNIFLIMGGFVQGFTPIGIVKNDEEGSLHDRAKDKFTLEGGAEEATIL